ncbi:MAG TPA: LytTR family DNA-binding domain-containing protein [Paludibacter sp.]|nr:LytTR family DNA-binding domain-containing protein [Paludibacter sp.]
MQIKCIVIDDEPLSIEKLSIFISKISWLKLDKSFNNAIDALNYLKTNDIDLIFLDIQMDEFSGIQFLESIKVRPKIIITSAYKEYAIQGYEFDVTDYLLKPFGFERFIIAIDKVFNQLADTKIIKRNYIFIKSGYNMERVNLEDILYIEGMLEYLQIVTSKNKLMTLQTFSSMESILPLNNFLRVHKSFIVAIDKIETIERNIIKIKDKRIPIGTSYKEKFDKILNDIQSVK